MKKRVYNYGLYILLIVSLGLSGCKKDKAYFSEPYADGKPPLGLVLDRSQIPVPATGQPGSLIKIKVAGLNEYKDKAQFMFNGQVAEIVEYNTDDIVVKVPAFASTGITSIVVDDVVVFGPEFTVSGIVKIDPTWQATSGTNGLVNSLFRTLDEKIIFVGNFTDYNKRGLVRPINRLVRAFQNGSYDVSWRTGDGANGMLNDVLQIQDRYYLGGGFGGYGQRKENISNLTRIHLNGTIDTMGIKPFRRPEQADTTKYLPTFNGGFDQSVNALYAANNKLIATGNFRYYVSRRYDKPNRLETRDTVILDSIEIRQLARLNLDGSLDKTYRFNGNKAFTGGNGYVASINHNSGSLAGKILVYGSFTKFDDQSVGYITRLNADGRIDATFNAGGSGADFSVFSVTFNEVTRKYLVVGGFKAFNGKAAMRMVMLNEDGSVDPNFTARAFGFGYPGYCKQLDNGHIVVSGDFSSYDNITRNGFMILNSDGSLSATLNTTGQFRGYLTKIEETTSEDGKKALLLMGALNKFDNKDVNNLIRIILE